jgi:chemotaxis protein methyltransferase CheR
MYLVETRLRDIVMESGCRTYGEFYERARNACADLRDRIIDDMTTNETSWFRDRSFWDSVRTSLIPELIERARQDGRNRLSIWSAACSTGQEPYSIAILLRDMERSGELSGFRADSFDIMSTDICKSALAIAEAGRYDAISMRRGLDAEYRDRYFRKEGRVFRLEEGIRKMVRFRRANLLDPIDGLGTFDIVFLRNVMIYFSQECKKSILAKVNGALRSEGALIVGATETVEIHTELYQVVRHGRSTYYRAKER